MISNEEDNAYAEITTFAKNNFDIKENVCYESRKYLNSKEQNGQSSKTTPKTNKCAIALTIAVIALVVSVVAACTSFALLIVNPLGFSQTGDVAVLERRVNFLASFVENTMANVNESTCRAKESLDILTENVSALANAVDQLPKNFSILEEHFISWTNYFEDLGRFPDFTAPSCASLPSSSPSGYYWVRTSDGSAQRVYCGMTRSCGNLTEGWMRVAELDMTNSSHQCPSGLQLNDTYARTCIRNSISAGCSSINISTPNVAYSRVCGRITAYQYAYPDAFYSESSSIDSTYVDGVSLTHGWPRQHIWTFSAATSYNNYNQCPCLLNSASDVSSRANARIPEFVGDDYFCDAGGSDNMPLRVFYVDDPLWDGAGCEDQNTCCSFNNPPWFYKQLPQPTTDDIEMRVCRNRERRVEDIAIESFDIYVE